MPKKDLLEIYRRLYKRFGPQHWWPGDTPFEVIIGAILTQNTNWSNVEKAINNLKKARLLTPAKLHEISLPELAELIRPAGYYNVKSKRLKDFIDWLMGDCDGDLDRLFALPTASLREALLSVRGIGPETADSIMLYAAQKPSFVVDAYTYRIFSRHKYVSEEDTGYDELKAFFEDSLEADVKLFNEYHALLVKLGKEFCKKSKPLCAECPLNGVNDYPPIII
ncbi:MAG: endonuclease III domain-containing protein [Planctomycetota bacterium]